MGDLAAYERQLKIWEGMYGIKTNLKMDLTSARILLCCKDGKHRGRVSRHHKGHEYLFATLLPDVYAKRYLEFRTEDVAPLCEKHHLKIHKLYEVRLRELWVILAQQDGKITEEQAEFFRRKLVNCFERWIARKVSHGESDKSRSTRRTSRHSRFSSHRRK